MMQPTPERRQQLEGFGMGAAHTCDQLGICQGRGDCNCQKHSSAVQGNNVWFVGTEPIEPTLPIDSIDLKNNEKIQVFVEMLVFLVMFLSFVFAGLWFGWSGAVRQALAAA